MGISIVYIFESFYFVIIIYLDIFVEFDYFRWDFLILVVYDNIYIVL